eukprot:gb/GECG01011473.1/.p1 GENE.gb/GECG01011473.1/~~gb/GECG01011473.1/.p1  ORF type:complete len:356 (+),score=44.85 gb/GECG01011473.1/:1-1068(+)
MMASSSGAMNGHSGQKRPREDGQSSESATKKASMTSNEEELYDRQIRLWGLEAQEKLRNGVVLIHGLNPLGVEAAKDLALAGINLILLDNALVKEGESELNFAIGAKSIGEKRANAAFGFIKELNPYIDLTVHDGDLQQLLDSGSSRIDAVVVAAPEGLDITKVNASCRQRGIGLMVASLAGLFGGIFFDLGGEFEFKVKGEEQTSIESLRYVTWEEASKQCWGTAEERKRIRKPESYAVYCILRPWLFHYATQYEINEDENALRDEASKTAETNGIPKDTLPYAICSDLKRTHKIALPATCAILGAVLSQEVIKAISHQDPPMCNLFVFDGRTGMGQEVNTAAPYIATPTKVVS